MNAEFSSQTAKIYQFPPRGRHAGSRGETVKIAPTAYNLSISANRIDGSAWYHDAAIKEERPGRRS